MPWIPAKQRVIAFESKSWLQTWKSYHSSLKVYHGGEAYITGLCAATTWVPSGVMQNGLKPPQGYARQLDFQIYTQFKCAQQLSSQHFPA
jgi:hypothetical protein